MAVLFAAVRAQAEEALTLPPLVYPEDGINIFPFREAGGRVGSLAASFRLTDDPRYLDAARAVLRDLCRASHWTPQHFLHASEATLAAAIGLDWLHEFLPAEERTVLVNAIVEKGLRASYESPAEWLWWIQAHNNWNPVCHGGLVAGALAVWEEAPELARRTVERAVANVGFSVPSYTPDGVYAEGSVYLNYGITFHVLLVEALRVAFGTTAGLDAYPAFWRLADAYDLTTGPTETTFNFADGHEWRGFQVPMVYFGREERNGARLQRELLCLGEFRAADTPDGQPRRVEERHLALALTMWDEDVAAGQFPAVPPLPLHWLGRGEQSVAVHRSAWDDPQATWVAIKGGTAGTSHAHMDVGSFVLEADGVCWAVDPGYQTYASLRAANIDQWNMAQDSPRWTVFRDGPEGHNIPRFNGAWPNVAGIAEATRFAADAPVPHTVFDLTTVYTPTVAEARRGVALLPDGSVLIQDDWTTGDHEVQYAFQWLTRADVTPEADGAFLRQNGESLRLRASASAAIRVEVEDANALCRSFDTPVPGLKRLRFLLAMPARSVGRFTLLATPDATAGGGGEASLEALAPW